MCFPHVYLLLSFSESLKPKRRMRCRRPSMAARVARRCLRTESSSCQAVLALSRSVGRRRPQDAWLPEDARQGVFVNAQIGNIVMTTSASDLSRFRPIVLSLRLFGAARACSRWRQVARRQLSQRADRWVKLGGGFAAAVRMRWRSKRHCVVAAPRLPAAVHAQMRWLHPDNKFHDKTPVEGPNANQPSMPPRRLPMHMVPANGCHALCGTPAPAMRNETSAFATTSPGRVEVTRTARRSRLARRAGRCGWRACQRRRMHSAAANAPAQRTERDKIVANRDKSPSNRLWLISTMLPVWALANTLPRPMRCRRPAGRPTPTRT